MAYKVKIKPHAQRIGGLDTELRIQIRRSPKKEKPPNPVRHEFTDNKGPSLFERETLQKTDLLLVFFFNDDNVFFVLSCSIYSNSALFTCLLLSGVVYMNTHKPIQTKPSAPITIKAISQPQAFANKGIEIGATKAPIEAPALKIEVA